MNGAPIYWLKLLPSSPTAVRCCQHHVTCGQVRQRYTLALPRGWTRFHPRTAQHTHTHTLERKKTHAGTCETNTDTLACTHTKNTHTYAELAFPYTNTYRGPLSLWRSPTSSNTHTHTHTPSEEARWNRSVGCWPFTLRRLDFSLILLLRLSSSLPSSH